ncbi:hypothetical protein MBLNU459_g4812t1 [Dothideomycetes sp. NU459]
MDKDNAPKKQELPRWFQDTRRKGISTSGNVLFTFLRVLDLPLQYHILRSGIGLNLVRRLGGAPIRESAMASSTAIGLSPYHSLIFGLAVGSAAKQIYWCLAVDENIFEPSFATMIATYNTLLNTLNTLLSLWIVTSNYSNAATWTDLFAVSPPKSSLPLGLGLYVVGIFTEWYCEVQRKQYKRDPANKGKLYTSGLFGLARNINYGGYSLWRTGYSVVCAGLPWGATMFAWTFGDFAGRAIPLMETFMEKKYGQQWSEVKQKVPYRLLPGIY